MSNKKILIRCDSSHALGTGHVMRCLVLAAQFRNAGAQVHFVCQNLSGNIIFRIEKNDFFVYTIPQQSIISDLQTLCELINEKLYDLLVLDHYDFSQNEESVIKQSTTTKIFSIDDLFLEHDCNFLLNHGIGASAEQYKYLVPTDCQLYVGAQFCLLRSEFKEQIERDTTKQNILPRLLVMLGGYDPGNINSHLIDILNMLPQPLKIDYVLTSSNQDRIHLVKKLKQGKHEVCSHIDSLEVAKLMANATCAIIAGGGSVLETLYMGLPTLAIQLADNQSSNIRFLKNNKLGSVIDNYEHQLNAQTVQTYLDAMNKKEALSLYRQKVKSLINTLPIDITKQILRTL